MGRPRVRNVAIALVLVLMAGAGSLVRYHAGWPLSPLASLGHSASAEGRRELRAFRRERVLDLREPSTRLGRTCERAAGTDWFDAGQPTEIRQSFALGGEPGQAVDAYRIRAEADGWRLVATECSFTRRSTSVTMTRLVGGRSATLSVYGYLGTAMPPERPVPGVLVTLTGMAPDRPTEGPEGATLRRRDVHCLRAFDPASPALLSPARLPASPNEICDLLSLAEAKRVVPAVTGLEPVVNGGLACRYGDLAAGGFSVRAADQPRAYYEDRQSTARHPVDRRVVIDEATPGGPRGAWVDSRAGPVEIAAGPASAPRTLDPGQVVALADLLARGRA
ncbi:MAG: hypothetical protein ACR2KK_15165 [Acidimicrobiales bacterium]